MTQTPQSIEINVKTRYLPEQLPDDDERYAFAYQVAIHNRGEHPVRLVNRYWLITDANGKKVEVQGPGVVGEQPVIASGESFQYTSGAVLETPVGSMEGHYDMEDADGNPFKAPIDVFGLAVPNMIN